MNALLIDPVMQTIETIDISSLTDIAEAIGYDTLESDAVGEAGDRIYFDENCFVRGTDGRFQVNSLIPLAGKCVVIGTQDDGNVLQDVATDIESLRNSTKFL